LPSTPSGAEHIAKPLATRGELFLPQRGWDAGRVSRHEGTSKQLRRTHPFGIRKGRLSGRILFGLSGGLRGTEGELLVPQHAERVLGGFDSVILGFLEDGES